VDDRFAAPRGLAGAPGPPTGGGHPGRPATDAEDTR
jgi:hypothetical protein